MTRRSRVRATSVRSRLARQRRDAGLASIELVILLPAFIALVLLATYLGRTNVAQSSIDAAAQDAARAASLQRNKVDALTAAQNAANATLNVSGSPCARNTTTVIITNAATTDPFTIALGQPSRVDIQVTCTVYIGDLVFPGLPFHGNKTMMSNFSSPIDAYRVRTQPPAVTP